MSPADVVQDDGIGVDPDRRAIDEDVNLFDRTRLQATSARDLFASGRIDGWAFDLEILALARRRGFLISEVGVEWADDGRSRVNPLKDMWKVVREALTIRRNLRRGVYNSLPSPA